MSEQKSTTSDPVIDTRGCASNPNKMETRSQVLRPALPSFHQSADAEDSRTGSTLSHSSSSLKEDLHWVQCENSNCLKWRILSEEDVEKLDPDASWFCYMNTDISHSSCDAPEEKYSSSRKMKRCGLTYKYSLLPEGSLVWAKLPGYCKWPSVLCRDPNQCEYSILDNDGDPHSYHVEFLGTKHSIAWVYHDKVMAYGNLCKQDALETCSQPLSQVSMNRFRTGRKKRKQSKVTMKKKISVQLAEQLQAAVDEANDLLELEANGRLEKCEYRYKEGTNDTDVEKTLEIKFKKKGKKGKKKKKKEHQETVSCRIRSNDDDCISSSQLSNHHIDHKLTDFASKEERLIADIHGLQLLEKEFEADYSNFMKRRSMTIKEPRWQGVAVNIFQLFMAVQDRGGFDEVCANRLWKEVVCECCDTMTTKFYSSTVSTAMSFYSRNLLPYEMYTKTTGLEESVTKMPEKKRILLPSAENFERQAIDVSENLGILYTEVHEDEALKELEEMEKLLNDCHEDPVKQGDKEIQGCVESQDLLSETLCSKPTSANLMNQEDTQSLTQQSIKDTPGLSHNEIYDLSTEVVPEVTSLKIVEIKGSAAELQSEIDSEEDLFAAIDRDEMLLTSLLSTT